MQILMTAEQNFFMNPNFDEKNLMWNGPQVLTSPEGMPGSHISGKCQLSHDRMMDGEETVMDMVGAQRHTNGNCYLGG